MVVTVIPIMNIHEYTQDAGKWHGKRDAILTIHYNGYSNGGALQSIDIA